MRANDNLWEKQTAAICSIETMNKKDIETLWMFNEYKSRLGVGNESFWNFLKPNTEISKICY